MKKIILIFIVLTTLISLVIAQEESVEAENSWSWNNLDDEQQYVLLSNEKPRVIALALEQIDNKKE